MISTVSFLEIDSVFDINNTFKTWRGKSLQLPYVNEAKFWLQMVLALVSYQAWHFGLSLMEGSTVILLVQVLFSRQKLVSRNA